MRFLVMGKRGPGELSILGGDAQHLTHFYAAPRSFFPSFFFQSSRLQSLKMQL